MTSNAAMHCRAQEGFGVLLQVIGDGLGHVDILGHLELEGTAGQDVLLARDGSLVSVLGGAVVAALEHGLHALHGLPTDMGVTSAECHSRKYFSTIL